jgi:hypothetical protein
MLWLTFNRHGSLSNNLDKLLRLDDANYIARIAKITLSYLLGLTISAGCAVAVAKLTFPLALALADLPGPNASSVLTMLYGYFYFVILCRLYRYLIGTMGLCWHVLFGLRPPWRDMAADQHQKTRPGMLHVEAIRVALRERAVTLPHDKAFSMLAILKTLGSEDVEVDYRLPLKECFKHLFVAIVKLHPPALLMLCDAGLSLGSRRQTGPSWVPNWMEPPPNAGISSQLHIPSRIPLNDTNFGPGDRYQIKGNSLNVRDAIDVGTIVFLGASQNAHHGDSLHRLCLWYHSIHCMLVALPPVRTAASSEEDIKEEKASSRQYLDSVLFATLEGLSCSVHRMQTVYAGEVNDKGTSEQRYRKPHEAPLNFSELTREFYDFLEFRAMLHEAYSADLNRGHDIAPWLRRKLNENHRAARY